MALAESGTYSCACLPMATMPCSIACLRRRFSDCHDARACGYHGAFFANSVNIASFGLGTAPLPMSTEV